MARRILLALALLGALLAPAAQAAGPENTRKALDRQMRWAGSHAGALVIDADTGQELYSRSADVPRVPASVNKLYTTATALLRFGGVATLDTTVLADAPPDAEGILPGNLYLRGGGDPTLGTAGLRALADAVGLDASLGEIDGRVLGDDSLFDARRGVPSSGWQLTSDVGPLGALVIDQGRSGLRRPFWQSAPATHAAREFARALKAVGVATAVKTAGVGPTPATAVELRTWPSPPMTELVRIANVPSNNFVAETLLKDLGARYGEAGTTAAGVSVVLATLAKLGIRPRMVDGSGLSRSNRTTPREVVSLLTKVMGTVEYAGFRESLAVAGRSGTLYNRMRRSPARDRCRGKTGTLNWVSTLAGYCQTRGGQTLVFAFLMNGVNVYGARKLQDRMLTALATYDAGV